MGSRAKRTQNARGGPADEVRVAEARAARDRARVDAEGVLEVGADVRVRVVHAARAGDPAIVSDPRYQAVLRHSLRRSADDDVRAECQLRIDARLLVVRRREEPEVHAEGEQEPDEDQAAVERAAAATGAREQEAAPRAGPAAGGTGGEPRQGAAADAYV